MPDWSKSMQQYFEYYVVDPDSWMDDYKLNNITKCTITRDIESDTLHAATIYSTEDIGEKYVRVYLITVQNGIREKFPLGTFLVQIPSYNFDGMVKDIQMDGFSSLIELKEKKPHIGYYVRKKSNILDKSFEILSNNMRAPVIQTEDTKNWNLILFLKHPMIF